MAKRELVDRLLDVERADDAQRERWLGAHSLVFWWLHADDCAVAHVGQLRRQRDRR